MSIVWIRIKSANFRTVTQLDNQPTNNCGLLYNQLALLLIYCAPRPAMRGDGTQLPHAMRLFAMYANPHNNVVLAQQAPPNCCVPILFGPQSVTVRKCCALLDARIGYTVRQHNIVV